MSIKPEHWETMLSRVAYDGRVYTNDSLPDADSIIQYCMVAQERGISGFTAMVRMDLHRQTPEEAYQHTMSAFASIQMAAEVFKEYFSIATGVELIGAERKPNEARLFVDRLQPDVVGGAVTALSGSRDGDCYQTMDFSSWSPTKIRRYLKRYFDAICVLMDEVKIDVLSGLSGPLRIMAGKYRLPVNWYPYADQIDRILYRLCQRDVALEFSMDRYSAIPEILSMDTELLNRYVRLGGKRVTLGSGTSKAEEMAVQFPMGALCLYRTGFTSFSSFQQRKPVEWILPELSD